MSEEKKTDGESTISDLRGCIVYACGLNPHGIARFESINTVVSRFRRDDGAVSTQCLPAIHTKAAVENGHEYSVDFPIFTIDVDSLESLDKVRDLLKDRIDKAFNAYKDKWRELKSKKANLEKNHQSLKDTIGKASTQAGPKK